MNYDYQKERDAIEDARYNAEWQYKLQQAAQAAAGKASGGSSRRSSGGGARSGATGGAMDYEGLFAAARASGNPKSWLAQKANYQKYGFTSSSGLYSDYENWLEGQNGGNDGGGLSSSASRILSSLEKMKTQTGSNTGIANTIAVYADQGKLTDAEARYLFSHFGYDPDEWLE